MSEGQPKHSILIQWYNTEHRLNGIEHTSPDHLPPSYLNHPKVKEVLDAMASRPDQTVSCAIIERDGIPVKTIPLDVGGSFRAQLLLR